MEHYLVTSSKSNLPTVIIATSLNDARQYNRNMPGLQGKLTKVEPSSLNPNGFYIMHTTPKAQEAIKAKNRELGIY